MAEDFGTEGKQDGHTTSGSYCYNLPRELMKKVTPIEVNVFSTSDT